MPSVQRMPSDTKLVDHNGTVVIPSYARVVDTDGTIVMHLALIDTTVVLTPSSNGNKVRWSCSRGVMKNLVTECRHPMADSIRPLVKRAKNAGQPSR